jgi:hypothetical protein
MEGHGPNYRWMRLARIGAGVFLAFWAVRAVYALSTDGIFMSADLHEPHSGEHRAKCHYIRFGGWRTVDRHLWPYKEPTQRNAGKVCGRPF